MAYKRVTEAERWLIYRWRQAGIDAVRVRMVAVGSRA